MITLMYVFPFNMISCVVIPTQVNTKVAEFKSEIPVIAKFPSKSVVAYFSWFFNVMTTPGRGIFSLSVTFPLTVAVF